MSILNVNTIQPIGSGTTVTVAATELKTSNFITVGTGASVTSPSANVLTLGTNTAERIRITSAGSVAIGVNSPSDKLHVGGNNAFIRVDRPNGNPGLTLIYNSTNSTRADIDVTTGGDLRFATNSSTERLRITSAGYVGINKTPSTYQFEVSGGSANTVASFESSDAISRILFKDNSGEAMVGAVGDALTFYTSTNATERLRITTDGRMGLGTNNPYHELHIQGSGDTRALITSGGTGDAVMMFENASGNTWGHGIDLTNNNYVIAYNNTSDPSLTADGKLEITTAGRLGVGLASPNSNLHIFGGSESTDNLLLTLQSNGVANDGSLSTGLRLINSTAATSIHGADIRAIRTSGSTTDLTFSLYNGNSPQTERLRLTSNGSVGIGINNPQDYHANANSLVTSSGITLANTSQGSIYFADSHNGAGEYVGQINYIHSDNRMEFVVNNTERMRLSGNGEHMVYSNGTVSALRTAASSSGSAEILYCTRNSSSVTVGTGVYAIYSNGSASSLSDRTQKKNIETTRDGYLEDLNRLRVVKYNWNDQEDGTPKELGLIAQEVEEVFPGLISNMRSDVGIGTTASTKGVKTSVLPYMLLKALQEANAEIVALKARVNTLEGS